jgi:ABC-type antimicrobial peptide transport system permease subunit
MFNVRALDDAVYDALAQERFAASILVLFALIGVVLATVAVHGLTAQVVRARTGEIRIRKTFGATDSAVVATLTRPMLVSLIAGLAGGVAAAIGVSGFADMLWMESAPSDPEIIAGTLVWVTIAVMAGTLVPLRRALRVTAAGES